jgi:hypothetical protein
MLASSCHELLDSMPNAFLAGSAMPIAEEIVALNGCHFDWVPFRFVATRTISVFGDDDRGQSFQESVPDASRHQPATFPLGRPIFHRPEPIEMGEEPCKPSFAKFRKDLAHTLIHRCVPRC